MASTQTLLKSARLFHLYSGVFLAPAFLFFAFTGGVQTFSLHETTRGSSYKPPAILVELGQMHKKQTLVVPVRRPAPPEEKGDGQRKNGGDAGSAPRPAPVPAAPAAKTHNLLPMKIFFVIVSVGLFFSTLTGLYMAYRFARNKVAITATLVAGVAIPLLLLLF